MTVLAAFVGLFDRYLNGAGMWHLTDAVLALVGLAFAVFVMVTIASASCYSTAKTMG